MKHVACVSKQFRSLCLAPQLLRSLDIHIPSGNQHLARCEALLAFLATYGQHMQKLSLNIEKPENEESTALVTAVTAAVASCLGACGASGSLQRLVVSPETPVSSYAWLSGLTRLRVLVVGAKDAELRCPPGISRLQCLGDLSLFGLAIDLAGVRLPPSLTSLLLRDEQTTELPHQVGSAELSLMPSPLPGRPAGRLAKGSGTHHALSAVAHAFVAHAHAHHPLLLVSGCWVHRRWRS